MNFNQKLDRHFNNLDAAYDELLEAKEQKLLETEPLEDEIMGDLELFNRLAASYARASLSDPQELSFLDWGTCRLRREREPEHGHAWEERPSKAEYWNWNDDRV